MGAWGEKPYENDSAYDWLNELETSKDSEFLLSTLEKGIGSEILDSSECEEIVAAAAIVNAASFEKLKGVPKEAKDWIKKIAFVPNKSSIDLTISSLSGVLEDSELLDLWREAKRDKQWLKCTKPILESLKTIDVYCLPERKLKPESIPRVLHRLVEREDLFTNPEIRKRIRAGIDKLKDLNAPSKATNGETPVTFLTAYGLFDEVLLLIQKGAKLEDLSRLLNLAAGTTSVELVELILDAGAQINHEYIIDEKSGFLAIEGRDLDKIVDEVNLVTIEFCPALMVAAMKGEADVIRLLVSRGANIFQTDNNGEGLLHYAARGKNIKVVEYLIACGLDVNLTKKQSNETPAHLCLKEYELLKLFLDNGTDPNMEDKWEGTLLDRAYICRASDKTIDFLKESGAKKTKDWIEDDRA